MTDICMYFQVHQPERLREYQIFEIGDHAPYFHEAKNEEILRKVARKCYLPANNALLDALEENDEFNVAFSISGTALEQFERYAPDVLESFQELAATGQVEFLAETYYHSLSFLYNEDEFTEQVQQHHDAIKRYFDQEPAVFRNTELIYNDTIAATAAEMGYQGILAEGVDDVLGWRSPNYVYETPADTTVLLKNYKLSDDIAFRFSNEDWAEHPLSVEKYAHWLSETDGDVINLFMDYETFGEHHWEDTGILEFLRDLPGELLKNSEAGFVTPSQALSMESKDEISVDEFTSWADEERDLSAWCGNNLQDTAMQQLYELEEAAKREGLTEEWRKLTTSDHFYYMCIKWFNDGDVHKYFNPYDTPYEAYIAFMNVLNDISYRCTDDAMPVTEQPSLVIE